MIRKYGNSAVVQIATVFESVYHVACQSYDGHLFFENISNLMHISQILQKIHKKAFIFEIIASELVALNCLY